MSTNYFWQNGKVRACADFITLDALRAAGVQDLYSVEPGKHDIQYRYGMYQGTGHVWKHIPLEEFPKEFRMQLLLMGVQL